MKKFICCTAFIIVVACCVIYSLMIKPKELKYYADWLYLNDLMDSKYICLKYLRNNGCDVDSIRKETGKRIKNIDNDEAFLKEIESYFAKLQNQGHLYVWTPEEYDEYRISMSDFGLNEKEKNRAKNFYSGFKIKKATKEDSLQIDYNSVTKVLYLRIPKMDGFRIKDHVKQIKDYIANNVSAEVDNIIIDITGNTGGSDSYWINVLLPLIGCDDKVDYTYYYKNTAKCKSIIEKDSIIKKVNYSKEGLAFNRKVEYTIHFDKEMIYGEKLKGSKVWLLVDNAVYSASEKFADFCKRTKWATVVGTGTRGDGMGITPTMFVLPNTGMMVRFSEVTGTNADGEMSILHGIQPNYTCLKNEKPIQTVYRLIDEGK